MKDVQGAKGKFVRGCVTDEFYTFDLEFGIAREGPVATSRSRLFSPLFFLHRVLLTTKGKSFFPKSPTVFLKNVSSSIDTCGLRFCTAGCLYVEQNVNS